MSNPSDFKNPPDTKALICDYLKLIGPGRAVEIAKKIGRHVTTVHIALTYLKKQGIVSRSTQKMAPYVLRNFRPKRTEIFKRIKTKRL